MKRPTQKTRTTVWDRDDMQCNRCGYVTLSAQIHHRRLKGLGGGSNDKRGHTDCPCNLILLCPRCHQTVHERGRKTAQAEGFIVSRYQPLPGEVAVLRFGRVLQRPTCEGGWAA